MGRLKRETDYVDATDTLVRSVVTGPLFTVFTNHNAGSSVERDSSALARLDGTAENMCQTLAN
jgi:hypothetical protein